MHEEVSGKLGADYNSGLKPGEIARVSAMLAGNASVDGIRPRARKRSLSAWPDCAK